MSWRMNRSAEFAERKREEAAARRAAASLRNDELLKSDNFRDFLAALANRAEYFHADYSRPDEWYAGYHAALRDIVNGVVMNSSKGADWLRDYAAQEAEKHAKTENDT